jgi:hypothetical protein
MIPVLGFAKKGLFTALPFPGPEIPKRGKFRLMKLWREIQELKRTFFQKVGEKRAKAVPYCICKIIHLIFPQVLIFRSLIVRVQQIFSFSQVIQRFFNLTNQFYNFIYVYKKATCQKASVHPAVHPGRR